MFATCCILILFSPLVFSWDSEELELFDLVEEVNANFYDVLGVDKGASSSEIRKAYRKQSLILHPDKNKAEDAEEQFRKLVAVFEVLKDPVKRERYNVVLENGLPDWRQPVFYYRRVRKMGVLELSVLLALILTVGQYLVLWSIYIEKKFTLEDNYRSKKKNETKNKNIKFNEEVEEELKGRLEELVVPRVLNLWPAALTRWTVFNIIDMPIHIRHLRDLYRERQERIRLEKEEKEQELEEMQRQNDMEVKRPKRKPRPDQVIGAPVAHEGVVPVVYGGEIQSSSEQGEERGDRQQSKSGDWSDEEYVLLSKAYIKFPGGTTDRWEKIADMVGRPVAEVTNKCKSMKGSYQMTISSSVQGGNLKPLKKSVEISDNIISKPESEYISSVQQDEDEASNQKVRKRPKNKLSKDTERTLMIVREPVRTTQKTDAQDNNQKQTGYMKSDCKSHTPDTSMRNSETANQTKSAIFLSKKDMGQSGSDSDVWSQNQQVILEWALKQYPKTTEQRWEKIAEHIPGKNKDDCVARFKHLAELVKQRKQQS